MKTLFLFMSKEYASSLSIDKLEIVSKLISIEAFFPFTGNPVFMKIPVLFASLLKN